MGQLRVYLADDHTILREGLVTLINRQSDMQIVGQAGDGQTVLRQAPQIKPTVVVMDISMPKLNGIEATERLKQIAPETKIVVLSRYCDVGHLRLILQAGAAGYVSKQSGAADLLTAIRAVAAGGTFIDRELSSQLVNNYLIHQTPRELSAAVDLTEREEDVLRQIAWGHSNKEIADQLGISIKTVEYHKARAMEKLALHSRAEVVNFALHHGWLQEQ